MKPLVVSRQVTALPAEVWQVLADVDSWQDVLTKVVRVEVLSPRGPLAVGTRWRETRRIGRREGTEEMHVTAVDPGTSYTVEAGSGTTHYLTRFHVAPAGSGTQLTMTFGAEVGGGRVSRALAAAMSGVAAGMVRAQLRVDLDDIAAAAEARA